MERLDAEQARKRLRGILTDGRGRIGTATARNQVRALVGFKSWPPIDPHENVLALLDPDSAPDPDDASPSAMFDLAGVMLSYAAHLAFELGRGSERSRADKVAATFEQGAQTPEVREAFATYRQAITTKKSA